MPCLVLDTSTERGVVAAIEGGRAIFHVELPFGLQSAQSLLPALHQQLADCGLAMDQLTHIGVGVGPGSYTGIRVGVTVAKSLSFACNLPLAGICSLDCFVPKEEGLFAAVIDAKIGGVYLQLGKREGDTITRLSEPMVCGIDEAVGRLKDVAVLVTPNAVKVRQRLEAAIGEGVWRWEEKYPSCERLEAVAAEKLRTGVDGPLELLYLRGGWF